MKELKAQGLLDLAGVNIKGDPGEMWAASEFVIGVAGNSKQRRKAVRAWRSKGLLVRHYPFGPGAKLFRVGEPKPKNISDGDGADANNPKTDGSTE